MLNRVGSLTGVRVKGAHGQPLPSAPPGHSRVAATDEDDMPEC